MKYSPIAIIGQGCVYPDANSPAELTRNLLQQKVSIYAATGEDWGLDLKDILPDGHEAGPGRVFHTRRGYVNNFVPAYPQNDPDFEEFGKLGSIFRWTLHAVYQSLQAAGVGGSRDLHHTGLIMGSLLLPTREYNDYYCEMMLGELMNRKYAGAHPADRLMGGLPAMKVADFFGMKRKVFSLDAACASSLYAVKLACDELHAGRADLMVAAGVCASDTWFLNTGFTALNALSRTGQIRPFHREADGLIPSQGAGAVVLKRLDDAVANGDPILGVIRGIGLSNDGNAGGFLAPSSAGQVRAIRQALDLAGIRPEEVSFIECHATGTPRGDATEIESVKSAYGTHAAKYLGSVKSNLGHLLASSGMAGIIKILNAFEQGVIPGTASVTRQTSILNGSAYQVHHEPVKWEESHRVAAVSNFGFGGNNAHLILEEWKPDSTRYIPAGLPVKQKRVAVVGVDILTDQYDTIEDAYFGKKRTGGRLKEVAFDFDKLGSPPKDLEQAAAQQLLAYKSAHRLMDKYHVDAETTGVFVGIGVQDIPCQEALKMRMGTYVDQHNSDWVADARKAVKLDVNAALILGTLPNLPANRINSYFDLQGEGFTIAAEELSGSFALDVALEWIARGRLTGAIATAADAGEVGHSEALRQLGFENTPAAGVVSLLLKSEDQAVIDGDEVLCWVEAANGTYKLEDGQQPVDPGHLYAAKGLMKVALQAYALSKSATLQGDVFRMSDTFPKRAEVVSTSHFGWKHGVILTAPEKPVRPDLDEKIFLFAGSDKEELYHRLQGKVADDEPDGAHRLAILATDDSVHQVIDDLIECHPRDTWQNGWISPQAFYYDHKISGEVAFVYTGAAATYKHMGLNFLKAFPDLLRQVRLIKDQKDVEGIVDWIYNDEDPHSPAMMLLAGSLLAQVHTHFTRQVAGVQPDVAFGLSAGETNSVVALGVIRDFPEMIEDYVASGFYQKDLAVTYDAVRTVWNEKNPIEWGQWLIIGDLEAFLARTEQVERAYVTMIHTDSNFIISGDARVCQQLIDELNPFFSVRVRFDFAIHGPFVNPVAGQWRQIHTRSVNKIGDIRFYSQHFGGAYELSPERVGDALTAMATEMLDLRQVVNAAWKDGARMFIEHGARDSLTQFTSDILKEKPHQTVALDVMERDSLRQVLRVSAQLWAFQVGKVPAGMVGRVSPVVPKITFSVLAHTPVLPPLSGPSQAGEVHVMTAPDDADYAVFRFEDFSVDEEEAETYLPEHQAEATPEEAGGYPVLSEAWQGPLSHPGDQPAVWQHQKIVENRSAFLNMMSASHGYYLSAVSDMLALVQDSGQEFFEAAQFEPDLSLDGSGYDNSGQPGAPETLVYAGDPEVLSTGHATAGSKDPALPGPKFNRTQLETLASGKISEVFGPLFRQQDHYNIQVRMPEPPLLLCDRVTGIEGTPGVLGPGTIWTESDVPHDSWYLHNNRMPAGIFIESGQADLLLVSWMGIDFLKNRGEKAYRLLGCELTFHGEMPRPGDTLKYEIHIDSFANHGDQVLFFFRYDCHIDGKLRVSVRNGQAGFFTKKELSESAGVLWRPDTAVYFTGYEPPVLPLKTRKTTFDEQDIRSYLQGDLVTCFGDNFSHTMTHTRTPTGASEHMNFIHTIPVLDFEGGPSGRGYLKSEWRVSADDWFYKGHFKNDVCMPGTMMADGCGQMIGFYMVAAGLTQNRDGWRFQPVSDQEYAFICRGQVTPASQKITYEIFVDRIIMDPVPTVYAHVLVTVDDRLKIFSCEHMAIELVPDFPITTMPHLLDAGPIKDQMVASWESFRFDYKSLINSALGNPKDAFGSLYEGQDLTVPVARLPAPPYHFISRILHVDAAPGRYQEHPSVRAVYDIPENAWYFNDNLSGVMPYSVMTEMALQPCGWLSTYALIDNIKNRHFLFRNLDGEAVLHFDITPAHRSIETTASLKETSIMGDTIIVSFQITCHVEGRILYEASSVFGYFDPEGMKTQKGHTVLPEEQHRVRLPSNILRSLRASGGEEIRLHAKDKLLMLDRMVYFDPKGGTYGQGYVRGEKDVSPADWYFKAHFHTDPVQPGSLGLEAIVQLIQAYLLHLHPEVPVEQCVFEPVIAGREAVWHYRGQVTPHDKLVILDFEVEQMESSVKEVWVEGHGRLWVNGMKIYDCPKIGVRMKMNQTSGD